MLIMKNGINFMNIKLKNDKKAPKNNITLVNFRLNLLHLMKKNKINATQIAKNINLPQPTVHRLLSGKTGNPKLSTLNLIAKYFSVSIDYLIELREGNEIRNKTLKDISQVPIIGWDNATNWQASISKLTPHNWTDWLVIERATNESIFALRSKKSMEPKFLVNSLIIVDPNLKPNDGDLVLVHFNETSEATVRKIKLDGPIQQLCAITGERSPDTISQETIIIGVIVQTRYLYNRNTSN
jgi:SOS-response transcriptional repressor LexA